MKKYGNSEFRLDDRNSFCQQSHLFPLVNKFELKIYVQTYILYVMSDLENCLLLLQGERNSEFKSRGCLCNAQHTLRKYKRTNDNDCRKSSRYDPEYR